MGGALRGVMDHPKYPDRNRTPLQDSHAQQYLAAIVESSDDAIVSKTLDGTVMSWNAAAERLFGYSAEHAIGRDISIVIPSDRLDEEKRIIARLTAGERIEHLETERVRADGTRVLVSLTISPIKDAAGKTIAYSTTGSSRQTPISRSR